MPSPRRATDADSAALADLFWRIREAAVPAIPMIVHPRHTLEPFLRARIARDETWVVPGTGDTLAGFLVLSPGHLEHLYLAPEVTGAGLGSRLVAFAQERQPHGLSLWAFQSNIRAIRFYARHGFRPVEWTDGDNEEGAPDVRMVWPGRAGA
ncbi:MAG: GNAT family N-acetyltransferase [Dermatophilaceae bacterium]